jgi:hypothetical protein
MTSCWYLTHTTIHAVSYRTHSTDNKGYVIRFLFPLVGLSPYQNLFNFGSQNL